MPAQYNQVLHYPRIVTHFSPSKEDISAFITLIVEHAIIVKGLYEIKGISQDSNNDMFIACAVEADAQYIVSRDPHLRNIKHYHGIQIIDATTFIAKVRRAAIKEEINLLKPPPIKVLWGSL
jgi:uncharacterized protein